MTKFCINMRIPGRENEQHGVIIIIFSIVTTRGTASELKKFLHFDLIGQKTS